MNTKKKNDTIDYVVTGNPGKKADTIYMYTVLQFLIPKKKIVVIKNNSCQEEIVRNTFELDPYLISNLKRFHI